MSAALSPEQQAAFEQLQVGISYDQWVWFQARRLDGRYVCLLNTTQCEPKAYLPNF
jgi:hypothetical protein